VFVGAECFGHKVRKVFVGRDSLKIHNSFAVEVVAVVETDINMLGFGA